MITIQILGLDQFVVGRYSRENTGNLAQLFQCGEDDISFYAPNSMMFHNGVEQTSWNIRVIVLAPSRFKGVEKDVADFIGKTLNLFAINMEILFQYFEEENRHVYRNMEFPLFISQDEIKDQGMTMRFGEMPEEDEIEESEEERISGQAEADVFVGDAFEGFEERYEANLKKKN